MQPIRAAAAETVPRSNMAASLSPCRGSANRPPPPSWPWPFRQTPGPGSELGLEPAGKIACLSPLLFYQNDRCVNTSYVFVQAADGLTTRVCTSIDRAPPARFLSTMTGSIELWGVGNNTDAFTHSLTQTKTPSACKPARKGSCTTTNFIIQHFGFPFFSQCIFILCICARAGALETHQQQGFACACRERGRESCQHSSAARRPYWYPGSITWEGNECALSAPPATGSVGRKMGGRGAEGVRRPPAAANVRNGKRARAYCLVRNCFLRCQPPTDLGPSLLTQIPTFWQTCGPWLFSRPWAGAGSLGRPAGIGPWILSSPAPRVLCVHFDFTLLPLLMITYYWPS